MREVTGTFYLTLAIKKLQNLTALYKDGVVTEEQLQGDTEIIIFFFADLEGTGWI